MFRSILPNSPVSLAVIFFACGFLFTGCQCSQRDLFEARIIAHRGASGYLPEHTSEAVAMAHGFNVDFMEPDVVLTRDGVPIVLHDLSLEATTNVAELFPDRARPSDGRWYAIDFDWAEIRTLRVSERSRDGVAVFPGRYPIGENQRMEFRILSLAQWIELVEALNQSRGVQVGIYPEIKASEFHQEHGMDALEIILRELRDFGYEERPSEIFLQSFHPQDLIRAKEEFETQMPLVQLIGKNEWPGVTVDYEAMLTREGLRQIATYAAGIGPGIDQLYELDSRGRARPNSVMKWAHEYGLEVHPYTHRSDRLPKGFESLGDEEYLKFIFRELKVDGLFTDFPDKAVRHLAR